MMKRFSTSCCLITFFLLNSVMLYAQHENTSVQQWKIEDESRALQMIERADTVELIVPGGLTMWYQQRLTGDYEINYRICMVIKGGKYDRLSDLNCFWAANDPKNPDNLFARSEWRNGVFKNYNTLDLFLRWIRLIPLTVKNCSVILLPAVRETGILVCAFYRIMCCLQISR